MQNDDDQNKAWCMRMAELEGDAEIGAGDPKHPLRCPPRAKFEIMKVIERGDYKESQP